MTVSTSHDAPNDRKMASKASQEHTEKITKRPAVVSTYLVTPPENTVDSFSQDDGKEWLNTLPPLQAHTPPASPEDKTLPSISTATGFSGSECDPQLFPGQSRSERARSQTPLTPLFDEKRQTSPRPQTPPAPGASEVVSQFPESNVRGAPDTPPESQIFPTILGINTAQAAQQYYNDRMAELRNMRCKLPSPRGSTSSGLDSFSQSQVARLGRFTKAGAVTKPRPTPRTAFKARAAKATSPPARIVPTKRRTPKPRTSQTDFLLNAFPNQSSKHKRAPPSKKIEGDGLKWDEMEDYSPPGSNLEQISKTLKATWRGNPLDLSEDPDRARCHSQEIAVAAELRLTCAQYLTCKRKIFQARLQALKDGKNFTKTAAQGACNIDVNKASQLWEAYDRVGWFRESWFSNWLV